MTAPLHVVHVITTLTNGGAERQLELLVGRSRRPTTVVCLYEAGPVAASLVAAGHRVELLGMSGGQRPLAWLRLARLLRRLRPDVVHVHLLAAQLWGIPAARLAGVPVIVSSEHSLMDASIEGRPLTASLRALYRVLERLTTRTVAVSGTTQERLVRWGVAPERVTVIENGIDLGALAFDPDARRQVRDELDLAGDVLAVGVLGRLDPVKRVDEAIEAVAPLLRAGTHRLVVVGTGSLEPVLRQQVERLGLTARVCFTGPRDDVPRLLSGLDAVLSASRDETFGLAVLEALAAGLPVVYAQCPALEELAAPPPAATRARPGALAQTAREVLTVLPARSRRPPPELDRYDVATTVTALDRLYERLTGRTPQDTDEHAREHGRQPA